MRDEMQTEMKGGIKKEEYARQVEGELHSILRYWMDHTPDEKEGGFLGRIGSDGRPDLLAPKGLVLNSRILWTFSAAWRRTGNKGYAAMARRAYDYLVDHFLDTVYGGAFWSVDHRGAPLNDRKQIYGLAFLLYGLSEYYLASSAARSLDEAISLFRLIEQHSFDPVHGGYYEAFARDWRPLEDLRLSAKDANEKKTMNTHLHIMEAYSTLFRAWPDPVLRKRIIGLLEVFLHHIIDDATGHLFLFFAEDWSPRSGIISYGHDIEAAWLLQEAAGTIADSAWIEKARGMALKVARAAAEGLDEDGGLWYESEEGHLVREKHWWPQAEAMVGFLNARQVTGDDSWLMRSMASWDFIRKYIRDEAGGEWHWGVQADHSPMPGQDKTGFWKCPYHNSRACLEVMDRLSR
jgi:mannobiose 2-epimerase